MKAKTSARQICLDGAVENRALCRISKRLKMQLARGLFRFIRGGLGISNVSGVTLLALLCAGFATGYTYNWDDGVDTPKDAAPPPPSNLHNYIRNPGIEFFSGDDDEYDTSPRWWQPFIQEYRMSTESNIQGRTRFCSTGRQCKLAGVWPTCIHQPT